MTIQVKGKFNNIFNGFELSPDRIREVLDNIRHTIIGDNIEEDPKFSISRCGTIGPAVIVGSEGAGRLTIEIVMVTCLDKVKIRSFDYDWDMMVFMDKQNKFDYTYDEKFFHNFRDDAERDCGEV